MDLFDWLDIIKKLKEEGMTQEEIAKKIEWSTEQVKQYSVLLNNIVTDVLGLTKKVQEGRVTKKVTTVTSFIDIENTSIKTKPFNFTEWWFRNSGLYAGIIDLMKKGL